ncbi:quinohemoprotein amine dehydrogenase subunit beta [Herminiimonas sp. CN]|uniref:quinohemoprotein amine dehydrogenase subunit beta n=1 Tax=Herminiimonas sp. CN TaxID=1349818 RepID=UPI000473E882|nr:quinohemoprotein amine dehydrogenase subunit beta [Herminiimonas sp. CN]
MKRWIIFLITLLMTPAALAGDYLLTGSRPNSLQMIDLAARKVVRTYQLPGEGAPSAISAPANGKIAYVLTNHFESVVGIDLDSGQQVFRADMSTPEERVKAMMGMTVSLDGSKLYVYQIPTRMKRSKYESLDTRIAVYNTADGIGAKPVKTFPAPRRITILAPTADRDRVVGLGWDLYVFDARAGKVDKTHLLRHSQRKGFGEPDVFSMWNLYEQARVLSTPYYVAKTDVDPKSPEAFKVGIMNFDLATEKLSYDEIANAEDVIFSSVVNPVKRTEVFAVMNQVFRADTAEKKLVQRVQLDRTYYAINISSDGREVYLGGGGDTVAVYDTATLTKQAEISIPGGADQSTTSLRIIQR